MQDDGTIATNVRDAVLGVAHLGWVPATALVGFLLPFLLADIRELPVDLYYLLYFCAVTAFAAYYVRATRLHLSAWLSRRLIYSIILGIVGGIALVQGVLAQPATPHLAGLLLWWALLWRGVVYGLVDGMLLFSLPWLITWRAFDAETSGPARKIAAGVTAWLAILLVTTVYHFGYADFRSAKIVQPNVGSAIGALPTILSANPIGSSLSHVFLHVAAVLHAPETDLFLPPHRSDGEPVVNRAIDGEPVVNDAIVGEPAVIRAIVGTGRSHRATEPRGAQPAGPSP